MRKFINRAAASDATLITFGVLLNGGLFAFGASWLLYLLGVIDRTVFETSFHTSMFAVGAAVMISVVAGRDRIHLARAVASVRKERRP